jgi:hypothetical protein
MCRMRLSTSDPKTPVSTSDPKTPAPGRDGQNRTAPTGYSDGRFVPQWDGHHRPQRQGTMERSAFGRYCCKKYLASERATLIGTHRPPRSITCQYANELSDSCGTQVGALLRRADQRRNTCARDLLVVLRLYAGYANRAKPSLSRGNTDIEKFSTGDWRAKLAGCAGKSRKLRIGDHVTSR